MNTTDKPIMTEVVVSINIIKLIEPGIFCSTLTFDDGTYIHLDNRYIYSFYNTKVLNYRVFLTESQFLARDNVKVSCTYGQPSGTNSKLLENLEVKIMTSEECMRLENGEDI